MLNSRVLFRRSLKTRGKHSIPDKEDEPDSMTMNEEISMENITEKVKKYVPSSKTGEPLISSDSKQPEGLELLEWKKNFHFATFPLYEFGNWISFVMARWPCLGTGCGLPQVALKNSKGTFLLRI
jgi:hypothetical protein